MGDLQVFMPRPNGVLTEDRLFMSDASSSSSSSSLSSSSPPLPSSSPDTSSIDAESWARAEQTTKEIVCMIQPTAVADQKRKEVIDYVQRLIRCCLGCEVFPYGSVPLKTYLPDGDIDLTALSSPNVDDILASDVRAVLEGEEQNEAAEYEVKDVQFIDAEVKLVKCLVQNMVVDISFNQLGGLCTLCFLEKVDFHIGKDHLFKRSIILIKAWCYYESRILGAHHGLISTYALETLVLYIFHQFHSSLNGPLAVLYKFLDYFSKFDWENYCISLNGPVCKSSMADTVAEVPKNDGDDLLLSEEFLKECMDIFSVPSRGLETNSRAFPQKHLNIIDPLKENNNLGRSVHRGNFYRIRSAFKYGARKLGWILLSPRERIADELNQFFTNTLERHGAKYRANANSGLTSDAKGSCFSSSSSCTKMCSEDNLKLLIGFSDNKISGVEDENTFRIIDESESSLMEVVSSLAVSDSDCSANGNLSGYHRSGDAKELAASCLLGSSITNDVSDCSPSSSNLGSSLLWNSQDATNFNVAGSVTENGKTENGHLCQKTPANSVIDEAAGSILRLDPKENHLVACNFSCLCSHDDGVTSNGSAISSPEVLNSLLDLRGDYDSHFRSLQYGQHCHGYALSPSQLRIKKRWDTIRRSLQFTQNFPSQIDTNAAVLRPPFYPLNHPTLGAAVNSEEKQKPRGTGTYFPNVSYLPNRDRSLPRRGRNQAAGTHGQLRRHSRNNGLTTVSPERDLLEEGRHELSQAQYPVLGLGKSGLSDFHQSHPSMQGSSIANGFSHSSERLEFGSIGHLPLGLPSPEGRSPLDSGTPRTWGSAPSLPTPAVQAPRPVLGNNLERVIEQSYRLKDEDFPPLSH
ncbi:hypothetical protein L1049_013620 [Liquidambar formosana]|uniref:Uncharacterized protein n=1 Tax=Liquidambar formosana TaxID=63359 RepID=A0AAP0RKL1_LIQFO